MANFPRNHHSVADLQQAIKEKGKRYETTTMSSQEEKKLLREIDQLKAALPAMEELGPIEPQLAKLREERKKIQADLDVLRKHIDDENVQIDDIQKASQVVRDSQAQVREAASKFSAVIDKTNEELSDLYKTKDKMREDYFKALYEWEVQNDLIIHIKTLRRKQTNKDQQEADRAERMAKKKAEIEALENPNRNEIDTCDVLIAYCKKLKAQWGLVAPKDEEVAKVAQQEMINEYRQQDIAQKLSDGKLMAVEHKKEELFTVGGGNKGKKGKKQKTQQKEATDSFQIDFTVINKFGLVRISPPSAPSGLDAKIEELIQNQKDLKAAGEQKL